MATKTLNNDGNQDILSVPCVLGFALSVLCTCTDLFLTTVLAASNFLIVQMKNLKLRVAQSCTATNELSQDFHLSILVPDCACLTAMLSCI